MLSGGKSGVCQENATGPVPGFPVGSAIFTSQTDITKATFYTFSSVVQVLFKQL
jgi:hypothetical protein